MFLTLDFNQQAFGWDYRGQDIWHPACLRFDPYPYLTVVVVDELLVLAAVAIVVTAAVVLAILRIAAAAVVCGLSC